MVIKFPVYAGCADPSVGRQLGEGFTRAIVAVCLPAAAMEVPLRCLPKFRPLPRTYPGQFGNRPQNSYLTEDAAIGWRLKPNRRFGPDRIYRSNSLGFRSDREFDASPQIPKVVLVGDSFTFGVGVSGGATFGSLLEQRLGGTPVCNLGTPGFGLDQMWLTWRHYGLPLGPRLAIVAFISGDFTRSEEAYRPWERFNKPAFKLVGGELAPMRIEDRPPAIWGFLDRYSAMWRVGGWPPARWHHFAIGEWWRLNSAILDRIRSDCTKRGVTPLVVYIPMSEWREFPALKSYMRQTRADFIDMKEKDRLPLAGTTLADGHPNEAGHRYIAKAIAGWIAQNKPDLWP
jgi:hypothetical protein